MLIVNFILEILVELAERSPIIIQNSSNPSSRKIWTYDRTTVRPAVQDATFNMRGQVYRGHTNATALSISLVVSALSSESTWVLVLAGARRYALKTYGKKNANSAFRLG